MKNKNGFTVAEMMIALGLICVLIALAVPMTVQNLPNKNLIKFQRAFNSFQSAVQAVLMDATETQEFTDMIGEPIKKGDVGDNPCFEADGKTQELTVGAICYNSKGEKRINATANAHLTNGMIKPLRIKGRIDGEDTITVPMLCNYIAGKMNVKSNNCGGNNFTTTDGIQYTFSAWSGTDQMTVTIDVGGNSSNNTTYNSGTCPNPIPKNAHLFSFTLTAQGRIMNACANATKLIKD